MRIAVCGAQGVGKSYLSKQLSDFYGVHRIDEVARTVAARNGFKTNQDILTAGNDVIEKFQKDVFAEQVAQETKNVEFISDRSVFDILAYMQFYGAEKLCKSFKYFTRQRSFAYDLIIYCPIPGGEVEDDGFRLTDPEEQKRYDDILRRLLIYAMCPVRRLSNIREHWLQDAISHIKIHA